MANPAGKSRRRHPGSSSTHNDAAMRKIRESSIRGELVAVVGTGVSLALTNGKVPALSWKGLIADGLGRCLAKGKITPSQHAHWSAVLTSSDLDELLGAAEFMSRKLDAPNGDLYARWLEDTFGAVRPTNRGMIKAIRALKLANVPLCTLNYDSLLEQTTGLTSVTLSETSKATGWLRREVQGVLHLHGAWTAPGTCILGIRDYALTLTNEVRELIQRALGSFKRLLFVGCGDTFGDPNFLALAAWLRQNMGTAALQHYALVSHSEYVGRHKDANWTGFVDPISYGEAHTELPEFIVRNFIPTKAPKDGRKSASTKNTGHARSLEDYREFLLRDCGEMTIEGVRADMATAQQRFDLERLFVPLEVTPCPPDIPDSDPERASKLQEWHARNGDPKTFGSVFQENPRLALLALPGGGKTLLLKRLAVAYADPNRRQASADALPDLDLLPVLIRCREWREHIHRPILTLLRDLADVTGHASLTGLADALVPLFKSGHALLLVDGLDEIHDDGLRSIFVDHLESFLNEYKNVRLVVTSREAGFALVAPVLARFCQRWRVAPLKPSAIESLCSHWHRLMNGDSPQAGRDSADVARLLVESHALLRLAENPLLLTMLLVVKHGAGRLPPDRVSLYSRAVEVLLDTWNIKGHDPLQVKEAVPQLACVAFQLMRAGKQTATERELLVLLEEARERVPQIKRYAKDAPHEFLKRVELRSGLLVEAGHQRDGGGTVPFYQFRHLTFQEYLAAVAAAEGNYLEYQKGDTVLAPLREHLTAPEWKEVIPMAAVLARKQAEPLMAALVAEGETFIEKELAGEDFDGRREWVAGPSQLPAVVARLLQCLVEETEAAPETLNGALRLAAFFARGCTSANDWTALVRGPYGEELLHQAWSLYTITRAPQETWILNTCASLLFRRKPSGFWGTEEGNIELGTLLSSEISNERARGLVTCVGILWGSDMNDVGTCQRV